MGIRYYFTDELQARCAINDVQNLGYWATSVSKGKSDTCACIVETSELAEGIIETRYKDFIQ